MLTISLLGQFALTQDERPLSLTNKPAQLLLAYLLLNSKATHQREQLSGLLWPDSGEKAARKNLRNTVWRIRKAMGEGFLESSKTTLAIAETAVYQLDVNALTAVSPAAPVAELETAVAQYAGDLLPGYYDEWLFLERERVRAHYEQLMQSLLHKLLADQEWKTVRSHAEKWLAHGQQPEPAYRALMQSYAALGDITGVVNSYQRCIKALDRELGLPPSPETIHLYDQLLQQKPNPTPQPVADDPLPINHSQFTSHSYSPPPKPSGFVGREAEIGRLQDLLTDPACRLVTIVGIGGMGKTQLSLAFANHLAETPSMRFRDGILFVPLASVTSPNGIISAIAQALALPLSGQADAQQELLGFLANKSMLIVLDNFEQLVDHADLLSLLLDQAQGLKLLATCREPLHLASEWRLDLDGLPLDIDIETAEMPAAARLFEQAAQQVQRDFHIKTNNQAHVAALCQLVAGVPLAIKLAATWLRVMPLPDIVTALKEDIDLLTSRMRDVPARQRSIRVIFEHSWSLLNPAEQEAFGNLSVFRGGFTVEAAKAVTAPSTGSGQAVSPYLLVGLIDRGLLQFGNNRYDIHELTRQFATEKLDQRPDAAAIRRRHSIYYLEEIVCRNEANMQGSDPVPVVNMLTEMLDNIRAAWWWAIEQEELTLIGRVMDALVTFFELTGLVTEGIEHFTQAAMKLEQATPTPEQALLVSRLQIYQAFLSHFHRADDKLLTVLDKAEQVIDQQQDLRRQADLHYARASMLGQIGRLQPALDHFEKARVLFKMQERTRKEIDALLYIGEMQSRLDNPDEALLLHQKALALATNHGDIRRRALALSFIGTTQYYLGDMRASLHYLEAAVSLFEQLNDRLGYSRTMNNVSYINNILGNYGQALFAINRSIAVLEQIGIVNDEVMANDTLAEIYYHIGNYEAAEEGYLVSLKYLNSSQMEWQAAWIRQSYMRLLLEMGRLDEAKQQLAMAEQAADAVANLSLQSEVAVSHGLIAYFSGDVKTAVSHLLRADELLSDLPNPYYHCRVEALLGLGYIELGQLEQAEAHLQTALAEGTKAQRMAVLIPTKYQLARLAHLQGDDASALVQLEALASSVTLLSDKTAVLDLRYQITQDAALLSQLIEQYAELAQQTPRTFYRTRLEALQGLSAIPQ